MPLHLNATDAGDFPENIADLDSLVLDDVVSGESVRELALRVEPLLGKRVTDGKINFVSLEDPDGKRRVAAGIGAIVNENGVLSWRPYPTNFQIVTVADLERTHEEGLFEGDPHALLVDWRETGNGGITLAWSDLYAILEGIAVVGGAWTAVANLLGWLRERFASGEDPGHAAQAHWLSEFVQHHQDHWVAANANAQSLFYELTRLKRWRSDQVRRLFEVRPDEAATLLNVLGYDYNPATKLYELSTDPARVRFRKRLLESLLNHDPATWQEDLAAMVDEDET
jgi:hypothetical protein